MHFKKSHRLLLPQNFRSFKVKQMILTRSLAFQKEYDLKWLVFTAIIFSFTFAQAYLVRGTQTNILVEGPEKNEMEEIFFEGCVSKTCSQPTYKSKCAKEKPFNFFCHMKDQYPHFVRFTVKLKGAQFLSSDFVPTNGSSSLSNYKLTISKGSLNIEQVKNGESR